MEKILVSACLLGHNVRFDGGNNDQRDHEIIARWQKEQRIITICPEVAGGLSVPRPGCEIIGAGGGEAVLNGQATVMSEFGIDSTSFYLEGAKQALSLVKKYNIKLAILKNRSPSCGSTHIYDGNFSKEKIAGEGVTAALLKNAGVKIFHEETIMEAANYLAGLQ